MKIVITRQYAAYVEDALEVVVPDEIAAKGEDAAMDWARANHDDIRAEVDDDLEEAQPGTPAWRYETALIDEEPEIKPEFDFFTEDGFETMLAARDQEEVIHARAVPEGP